MYRVAGFSVVKRGLMKWDLKVGVGPNYVVGNKVDKP